MVFTITRPQLLPVTSNAFTTTSACGVCGSESIDAVRQKSRFTLMKDWQLDPRTLLDAARALTQQQAVFARTGGVHAAALVSRAGEILAVRSEERRVGKEREAERGPER